MESILEVAKLVIVKRNSYLFIQQIPFAFLLGFQMVKNWPAMQETWVQSLCWEDPMEDKWQPTPVFLPREFQGQRSLVGYSPWGHSQTWLDDFYFLIICLLSFFQYGNKPDQEGLCSQRAYILVGQRSDNKINVR